MWFAVGIVLKSEVCCVPEMLEVSHTVYQEVLECDGVGWVQNILVPAVRGTERSNNLVQRVGMLVASSLRDSVAMLLLGTSFLWSSESRERSGCVWSESLYRCHQLLHTPLIRILADWLQAPFVLTLFLCSFNAGIDILCKSETVAVL